MITVSHQSPFMSSHAPIVKQNIEQKTSQSTLELYSLARSNINAIIISETKTKEYY